MQKFIKVIIFLTIFFIIWSKVFNVLWKGKTPIASFYEEPKNSLDIVYVGASNAHEHFNTLLAYDLYGYTTGMMAVNSQPFAAVEFLIKESEKYQKPNLYIIDLTKITDEVTEFQDAQIRNTTDSMKFSLNRIEAINTLLKYKNTNINEYPNYYFSFLMYHNRWKDISIANLKGITSFYKGYTMLLESKPQQKYEWKNEVDKLQDKNKKILTDLIDYIKAENLNTLFIIPKRYFSEDNIRKLNNVVEIIQNYGLKVMNFNVLEDFEVDFNTDFYDQGHLNIYGATKNTLYFAKYLKENYELPDHRNDETYNSWKSEYERFKEDFKKYAKKDFNELLTH